MTLGDQSSTLMLSSAKFRWPQPEQDGPLTVLGQVKTLGIYVLVRTPLSLTNFSMSSLMRKAPCFLLGREEGFSVLLGSRPCCSLAPWGLSKWKEGGADGPAGHSFPLEGSCL